MATGLLTVTTACANAPEATEAVPSRLASSAVGIEAEGCSLEPAVASGAVVHSPGLVMTVAHAVAGSRSITVIDHEGARFPATLRFLDPESDIALLHVEQLADRSPAARPLPVSSADPPVDGQLFVRDGDGGIETKPVTLTKRLNVTIEDIYIDTEVRRTAFELQGEVTGGDSGGMVVVDGSVVAMVYARARTAERGFALDETELTDALAQPGATAVPGAAITSGNCVP